MREKVYNIMNNSGAAALAAGIVIIVAGITCGVLMIVSGARLLANKSEALDL